MSNIYPCNYDILSRGYACSTIAVGCFTNSYSFEDFKVSLRMRLENKLYRYQNVEDEEDDYFDFSDFAFVVASTSAGQPNIRKYLKELGFSTTEQRFNRKNGTNVCIHVIPVDTYLKALK